MNKKIYFSGQDITLDQNPNDVLKDMQIAIDRYFPTPNDFAVMESYNEAGNTISFKILRNYINDAGCSLGNELICDRDASLITGLDESAFQPFEPGKALIAPCILWTDQMCYVPLSEFCKLWKHQIKTMVGNDVNKITITPSINSIFVEIKF